MALEQYEHSLAVRISALGEDHMSVATTHTNIALVYANQGKYEMAMEHYAKCLAIQINVLGAKHPVVADTMKTIDSLKHAREYAQGTE